MHYLKRVGNDIRVFLVKAMKCNLGINGAYLTEEHEWLPEGIFQAFFANASAVGIGIYLGAFTTEFAILCALVFAQLYTFLTGFFVFPAIKHYLGFHFPAGNWFYLPRQGHGNPRLPASN